jgi:hypothetical protein
MTPHARAAYTADQIYPAARVQGALAFLERSYTDHAAPFFQRLSSLTDLLAMFQHARRSSQTTLLPLLPAMRVYLEQLLSQRLDQPTDELRAAIPTLAAYPGGDVIANHVAILDRCLL